MALVMGTATQVRTSEEASHPERDDCPAGRRRLEIYNYPIGTQ